MGKPIFVQVKIPEEALKELKRKSGESTNKEALSEAIEHYINCCMIEEECVDTKKEKKKRTGRDPLYLEELIQHYKK